MSNLLGQPALQVRDLCRHRGGEQVLERLSFDLEEGQMSLLIGPSGGGKSTLLRLLNRLDDPDQGEILLQGKNIHDLPTPELRRKVALVLQKPIMFKGSVLENLQSSFWLRQAPVPSADSGLVQLVSDLCGLDQALLRRDAQDLSVGQQQRVSLARSLMSAPKVLLLDEPTSALDRPSSDRLGELLLRLCLEQRLSVLMVAHDLRLAERIADHIFFLKDGRFAEVGRAEILRRPRTRELRDFLNEPKLVHQCQEAPA